MTAKILVLLRYRKTVEGAGTIPVFIDETARIARQRPCPTEKIVLPPWHETFRSSPRPVQNSRVPLLLLLYSACWFVADLPVLVNRCSAAKFQTNEKIKQMKNRGVRRKREHTRKGKWRKNLYIPGTAAGMVLQVSGLLLVRYYRYRYRYWHQPRIFQACSFPIPADNCRYRMIPTVTHGFLERVHK